MSNNEILSPYPNTRYADRFERETQKRLADLAIANAQQAVVSAEVIVSQIADVNAESVALQEEVNPDYKAKLDAEASAVNQSESEPYGDVDNSDGNKDKTNHTESMNE